jgi:hypothetical protein
MNVTAFGVANHIIKWAHLESNQAPTDYES